MKIKAQSGKVVFTGRVLDEETREPVPYAAVQIYVFVYYRRSYWS
ncbi:hypothetical protein HMPREF1068_02743 [Bacteroides nordii CL02T12C05]|uniref:Uncharacterized protein n=1 Tax=Bacteroides nordii CL02T12C05 TaxID=997884 RepID=I8XHT4_9BACE|nr:hypothetical protein HMPREF1068_02743 [Bacteroides nordii CL02T12C05]